MNSKTLRSLLIFVSLLFSIHSYSQAQLTSDDALSQFNEVQKTIEASFPQNEMRTFRRESFSEIQLKTYLTQHFKQLDLIPFIKDNHVIKLDAYLHSANWFKLIGMPKESIKSYKDFFAYYDANEQYLTNAEKKDYLKMRSFGYDMLAVNYAKISQIDSADVQHKFNLKFAQQFNTISFPSALNNYGLFFYWTKKDLETALIHFHRAFDIMSQSEFSNHYLLGSIRDNIADIYVEQNKLNEANTLYQNNFEFYKHTINVDLESLDITRLISAGSQYVSTSLALSQVDDAEKIFNELVTIINDPIHNTKVQPSSFLEILKAKEALYFKQNKFKDAYQISKEVKTLEDSLKSLTASSEQKWLTVVNEIVLDQVKQNFVVENNLKENKIKSQRSKLWITSLISSIFIILLLSVILRRRQYLIIAKNKQQLAEQSLEFTALKNEKLNAEIESKKRDLSDFAINLSQNQEWAKALADKLEQLKTTKGRERKKLLDDFEQDIQNKIKFDQDTENFYDRLDKLGDLFYSALHTNYPNLTKTEIRLCSLIRLKIDSHAIANLQNITLASLNTSRYRLRKKLNLAEGDNLDEFIQFL
ncbi:tetratricopeptide repeat protein [Psychroserpens sp. AS72]|uniref:transcriptional regulator n=1 Tax=Psychroserpens sp. AS72 TaxID=3135775 RepID=UPI00317E9D45